MKAKVEEFKGHIPLVQVMFNPGLRDRHWMQMSDIIGYTIRADEDMNLAKMVDMKIEPYLTKFEGISEAASKEFSLEKAMEKMMHEWDDVCMLCLFIFFADSQLSTVHSRLHFNEMPYISRWCLTLYHTVKLAPTFCPQSMKFKPYWTTRLSKHRQCEARRL